MAEERLAKAFKQAAAIAKQMPKHLQEAAFNRALDQLLGNPTTEESAVIPIARRLRSKQTGTEDKEAEGLLEKIDRTRYPDVGATNRVADRALKVLQLANDDHGVDGLSAQKIAEILTNKFRLPVSANSVNM